MILSADEIESVIEESDDDLINKIFVYCTNNLIKNVDYTGCAFITIIVKVAFYVNYRLQVQL